MSHLRLVMGTSMGGMHTWMWASRYPDVSDAWMPLASVPGPMSGRNRVWRRVVIDAIRQDPEWRGGEYVTQPQSLRTAAQMLWLAGSNPVRRQREAPTRADADRVMDSTRRHVKPTTPRHPVCARSLGQYDPPPVSTHHRAAVAIKLRTTHIINPPELQT